ncbi:MAG: DUF4393 domain-containing protein [Candidatus Coprovivens sp.]
MSDNTTNKNSLINVELPGFVDHAAENLTEQITANAGQTFGDIWFLVFGGISQLAEKKKMKYAIELDRFKKELEEKIEQIPQEKRVEANIQTIGPALENSKYCMEAEEIRQAFANLISRSLHQDYSKCVHPSFADMLKQMSPIDAQNLTLFKGQKSYPICDIHYTKKGSQGYNVIFNNLFLGNKEQSNYDLQTQSISSLVRFGLVDIPEFVSLANQELYDEFETNSIYLSMKMGIPEEMGTVSLKKKKIEITPLGEMFIKACL